MTVASGFWCSASLSFNRKTNLFCWNQNNKNACLKPMSAKSRSLRTSTALGHERRKLSSSSSINRAQRSSFQFTYLCMVPTSAGREDSRFPDKFSSVSEVISHKARGNSVKVLFDRLRLLSLQNLQRMRRQTKTGYSSKQ